MSIKLFHVDAFADGPFTGNPAAVCILDKERPDDWMQSVAAEMNLSETTFLVRRSPNLYNLRWMTPTACNASERARTLRAGHREQRAIEEPLLSARIKPS